MEHLPIALHTFPFHSCSINRNVANLLRGKTRQSVPDVAGHGLGEDEAYLTYVISFPKHGRRWRAITRAQRFLPVWACNIRVNPDISRIACSDRGYGRPSGRPRVADPATYCSSTPRIQPPAVARWHTLFHGLATGIHEISGLTHSLQILLQKSHNKLLQCDPFHCRPRLCLAV